MIAIIDTAPLRTYTFSRALTITEAASLAHWISRIEEDGSRFEHNSAGQVIGATCPQDDLADFLAEQRREKRHGDDRLKAIMQTAID